MPGRCRVQNHIRTAEAGHCAGAPAPCASTQQTCNAYCRTAAAPVMSECLPGPGMIASKVREVEQMALPGANALSDGHAIAPMSSLPEVHAPTSNFPQPCIRYICARCVNCFKSRTGWQIQPQAPSKCVASPLLSRAPSSPLQASAACTTDLMLLPLQSLPASPMAGEAPGASRRGRASCTARRGYW